MDLYAYTYMHSCNVVHHTVREVDLNGFCASELKPTQAPLRYIVALTKPAESKTCSLLVELVFLGR